MAGQHLLAGLADARTVLLQASQNDLVAVLYLRPENRWTSREQASCPTLCCADALEAIRIRGMTKRILLICYALVPGERNGRVI